MRTHAFHKGFLQNTRHRNAAVAQRLTNKRGKFVCYLCQLICRNSSLGDKEFNLLFWSPYLRLGKVLPCKETRNTQHRCQ